MGLSADIRRKPHIGFNTCRKRISARNNESKTGFHAYTLLEQLNSRPSRVAIGTKSVNTMDENSNEKLTRLLRETAQSNEAAFKALYDATAPRLLAVAITMMRDSDLAEDVLQDAFVQVWHRAGEFHADRGSVLTWLTTIVRYRAIDLLRKRRRGGGTARSQPDDVDSGHIDYLIRHDEKGDDDRQPGPLAFAISHEENSNLHDCVDRLSDSQQRSVALAFFRGFTHQELADCLAEPLGTIKSRLRRSLMRLKECLESLENGIEIRRQAN